MPCEICDLEGPVEGNDKTVMGITHDGDTCNLTAESYAKILRNGRRTIEI